MIRLLRIRQLALIDSLDIEFESGLNVVTGETGAGKSIVIDAIGLLLGERASADLVRTGADVAIVEAEIDTSEGEPMVVRRELTALGRSRAFVDDQLVTTAGLRSRTTELVDLYGQHEHQRLLQAPVQLELLDAFGELLDQRSAVAEAYGCYRSAADELAGAKSDLTQRTDRLDSLAFQLAEIDKVAPAPSEDDLLATRRRVLAHADRVQRVAGEAFDLLQDAEHSARATLRQVWKRVEELAGLDPRLLAHLEGRPAIDATLDELTHALRTYAFPEEGSVSHLEEVEARLAQLERLKRRHGPSLDEVIATRERVRSEIDRLTSIEGRAQQLDEACAAARVAFLTAAECLSKQRAVAGDRLCRALEQELRALAMARTRCEFRALNVAADQSRWSKSGIDAGELFISPNPGEELRPLNRIVSGGELSRLMLAFRTVAGSKGLPSTLIFDEVDAGIGGETADAVGARLSRLAVGAQVLCVTHLPQVAAYGDVHFRVAKESRGHRTMTRVSRLDGEDRIDELARMMAGGVVGPTVLAAAAELLASRKQRGATSRVRRTRGQIERSKAKGN